eukprot:CAMPEP_0170335446 /NCGR_PEP_ID=MMETSP0116_2-20130129/68762_1 /TAXON_ID=400756 /ORGANISM="Durinskia baltica, Strain CSIRO CS-38" /LENGTH=657 /DNA_ID=CAMNT_0010588827 /DNA_START=55 /DNA_END=2022 /DNA_ORIENTATION=+
MALAPVRLILLALGLSAASVDAHPVEKVIQLLKDLGKKALEEGKEEEVLYTAFSRWCVNSDKALSKSIAEEKETIERLQDEINSHETTIETLTAEMATLKDEIQDLDTKADEAQKARDADAKLYSRQEKSKAETDTLLVQNKVREVLALLGMRATAEQKETLEAFAGYEPKERPELKARDDRTSHVKKYAFKSDSVIELLKDLKLKFEDELTAMTAEETNAINAFTLEKQARDLMRTAKQASWDEKNKIKGERLLALAAAKSDLSTTQSDLAADTKTQDDTRKQCNIRKAEWEERSKVRAGGAGMTGVRTDAPSNPVPPPSPVAFIQVDAPKTVRRALELLRQEARAAKSKVLEDLAEAVERKKEGPFDSVINAIEKMIFRLMDEQKQEDDHKNWCDLELSKTNRSIIDKKAKLDELAVKIEGHDGRAMSLASDIEEAIGRVADIDKHVQEATEIRKVGKQENALAVKDAQDAQTAITQAIAVLEDFYKSSGSIPADFIQEPVKLPDEPSTWDSAYTHVADPKAQPDGIVSVLEKVSADFAQMESETKAQEESDQEAFDADMSDCEINKARLTKEAEMKQQERQRVVQKKSDMEKEKKVVAQEHEATKQYLSDLQPACVEGSSTYEDRKAARADEIKALTQAQDLLQNAFEEKAPAL